MISFRAAIDVLFAEPFRPVRIKLTSGKRLVIRHPDGFHLGLRRMTLSTLWVDGAECDRSEIDVPLEQVESMELLEANSGKGSG